MSSDNPGQKGVFRNLLAGQQRIEAFAIQIMEEDAMSVFPEPFDRGVRDGVVEAAGIGMGKNNRYFHGRYSFGNHLFSATALKNV
jgi:hypothetical protein